MRLEYICNDTYKCMHIRMYITTYAYMYVRIYVYVSLRTQIYTHIYVTHDLDISIPVHLCHELHGMKHEIMCWNTGSSTSRINESCHTYDSVV